MVRTACVDVRERPAEKGALSPAAKRAQRPGPGSEKGLTLTALQWGALTRLLPKYLTVLERK